MGTGRAGTSVLALSHFPSAPPATVQLHKGSPRSRVVPLPDRTHQEGRRMSTSRKLLGTLALGVLLPAILTSIGLADVPNYRGTANLELVAQIPGAGGTDLEMFSRTLTTYKTFEGDMVTRATPVERHFAFVGNQT